MVSQVGELTRVVPAVVSGGRRHTSGSCVAGPTVRSSMCAEAVGALMAFLGVEPSEDDGQEDDQ